MPNPAHLDKLCEGPRAWNAWRDDNPNIVPDLTEIKLTLSQRQLGPASGGPIDLHSADLEHASLPYATLTRADLEGARLVGIDLTHARLDGANLAGADLTDAILDQADMAGANLDQAVLFGADLSNTRNLTSAQLEVAFGDASTRLPGNILPPESWQPSADYLDDEDEYSGWGMPAYEPVQQNLYEVLGLTEKASAEEIRSSYRNLVKKLHPDLNPNDEEAQERFKRVTTAYRILNDPAQRQRYDRDEIDGEGRVNPEFEARRRFRRTAFRYYTAAAASFVLAVVALGAVWYTVLSVDPSDESPQVAVVSQPKRAERLGGESSPQPAAPVREQRSAALSEPPAQDLAVQDLPAQDQQIQDAQIQDAQNQEAQTQAAQTQDVQVTGPVPQEAVTETATPAPAIPDAPTPGVFLSPDMSAEASPPEGQAPAGEQPALSEPASAAATAASAPADTAPAPAPQTQPSQPEKLAAEPPAPTPEAAQPNGATPPAAPEKQAAAQPLAAPPPNVAGPTAPGTSQAGNTARPLPFQHNSSAGQTASFAPERWSMGGAVPQSRPPLKNASAAAGEAFAFGSQGVLAEAQRGIPSTASRLLGIRAIEQAVRKESRPFTASDGPGLPTRGVPEKRRGSVADLPTNSIPTRPRPATLPKRQPAAQSPQQQQARQPQQPPSRMAVKPQPARAAATPVGPAAPQARQQQQQQAVSDILAGGF